MPDDVTDFAEFSVYLDLASRERQNLCVLQNLGEVDHKILHVLTRKFPRSANEPREQVHALDAEV